MSQFLAALVTNDFLTVVKKADDLNIQRLRDYGNFLESMAPVGCYGSKAAYQEWLRTGGVVGRQKLRDSGQIAP